MVWIHGGGFVGGGGAYPSFDGAALMRRGVVVVTINYRLGVLGFLAHPDLDAESPHHTSGDYGLYDQLAALRWVQHNIARFGGDPRKVTVFGQSAGSQSVAALMTSPLAKGLFHQAILESGPPLGLDHWPARARAEQAVRDWGSIKDLRKLPAQDVIARWLAFSAASPGARIAGPVVDGDLISLSPDEAFATGKVRRMALIIGNNARDTLGPPSAEAFSRAFGANSSQAKAIYDAAEADPVEGDGSAQLATDIAFRCPTVLTQSLRAAAGDVVYAYQFEQSLPGRESVGAAHSFEVPYVFGNLLPTGFLGAAFTQSDRDLSRTMQAYWTNFAKTGDPNGLGLPAWHALELRKRRYMALGAGSVRSGEGLHAGVCALYQLAWDSARHPSASPLGLPRQGP